MKNSLIKVRFELDASEWHGHGTETLWAMPMPGSEWPNFQINNSPFFATGINYLDVVAAKPTGHDQIFDFVTVTERSGHSTYMLLMQLAEARTGVYWGMLERMGCSYESAQISLSIGERLLYSVDVPPTADIYEVYEMLERGENEGVWLFQEGHADIPESRTA
ncbi:DUF4265 domain-containing protein [Bradyrhizobium sp. CB3481]|uniref:DUF4265 domain-containing protein n=1 Tax=Bradyrhizobium sp. CB3481 TaxID=3039158 RepID=UPI0024B252CE|nr:DUF4265 domain-containing protein [Bradyrhizobium sp. CB3481]WFU15946.1 DUF4265 domain-containing protein [Bradyrhizobium sp. CB3481]